MAGYNTYKNWLAGNFVLEDTILIQPAGGALIKSPVFVRPAKISISELQKIEEEQQRIGLEILTTRINKARNHFIGVLRASISRSDLVADEIEGIERILEGYIPLKKDVYTSTCFGFDIYKDQCLSISSFYRTDIETGKNRNFRFIASPAFFNASNQGAPQGFAYLLYDLLKWLREFSYEKLAHFTELEQQKNFNIALHFANGNIQKWKSEGMSYRKIAQHIDVVGNHPVISCSYSFDKNNKKSIFKSIDLMKDTIEYCTFYGIQVTEDFLEKYSALKESHSLK